ncbi:MAG: two-component system sensor histidine kinase NtrB, partial [Bryobacteraceae bacterium]
MVRPQDLVWLLLFSALAIASPTSSAAEFELLGALAVLQVIEPRIAFFATRIGNLVSIGAKLLLGWLLMGVTGSISSSYFLILLVPVVTAATTLSAWGTAAVVALASASYVSFLLFLDWRNYILPEDQVRELCIRLLFLGICAYLIQQLGEAMRTETRRHQELAGQLAEANRSLRVAEAAVRRSERLAAMGQLMAGLAHELRNPLGTMRASAEVLTKKVAGESEVARELAGFIAAEVDRLNSLVSRFLDFAKPLEPRLEPVDVTEVIDSAIEEMSRRQPPFEVTVYRNYSPEVAPIPMDSELMRRVIYNLLVNAAEASPPKSAITVKTRPTQMGVEVSVIDRGRGIEPSNRESIFNPFFTTKPGGVGLGLAIVSRIVDGHGGTM